MGAFDYSGVRPPAFGEEATWFEYCSAERLMIHRCRDCAQFLFPPRSVCPHCLAPDPEWVEAAGTGTVFTFTVQHRDAPGFKDQAPYTIAMVDLAEGVRMMSRIVAPSDLVAIGIPVEVRWAAIEPGFKVPVFVPQEDGTDDG